ncbi:cytidine deaminase-like protein [Coprinellus micaceus]|uniref:Cytidine deaminase-like protein n=1 Tax=Coprinellus micaceus TaxID=71717 RepID=A0A4Y7U0E6_COPMI|nr:cytidine deaminase-like protein [Coprinellus micaceus]
MVSSTSSLPSGPRGGPKHLNSSGCIIKSVPGRGRGVYAERFIPRGTVIEISPVLLFQKDEYENYGKHTVLDHYTFVWPENRMALALGLGSLFNHADPPNVSFSLDPPTESIKYTTVHDIQPGQELCIFYGHKIWFTPSEGMNTPERPVTPEDGWGGLGLIEAADTMGVAEEGVMEAVPRNPYEGGDPDDTINEEDLPFTRFKPIPEEEALESIRTVEAWVVDVPDPKHLGPLIKWIKQAKLESPDVAHLKRIRKDLTTKSTTLLLSLASTPPSDSPSVASAPLERPPLPDHLDLPEPYRAAVPASSALTTLSLELKNTIWPTMFTPKRKDEIEPWTRGQARWAWDAMRAAVAEAHSATALGEKPIAAHIAVSYKHSDDDLEGESISFTAHDTRTSTAHPLRHAAINVIRKLADYQASKYPAAPKSYLPIPGPSSDPASPTSTPPSTTVTPALAEPTQADPLAQNGTHYLLTNQTVFLTHEPCIMCSMALLHSRVKEVFYLYPMPKTGGCGSLTCLPQLKGVNHRFGIARWDAGSGVGGDEGVLRVGEEIDA